MVRIIFSENARRTIDELIVKSRISKQERILLTSIQAKLLLLQTNTHLGNPIAKRLIPSVYVQDHDVTNLFRIELAQYWRMLYTLRDDSVEIIAFIIDVVDHKEYDKKFGYKK